MNLPATSPPAQALVSGVPLDFIRKSAAALARDIAMRIAGARELAHGYGLSDDAWDQLRNSEFFKQLLANTIADLSGAEGTMERIKRKSALALEEAIPEMFGIITSNGHSATARVAAFDALKETAGIKQNSSVAPAPAQFQLNISFPGQPQQSLVVATAQPDRQELLEATVIDVPEAGA